MIFVSLAFAVSHSVDRNDPSFQEIFVIENVVLWPLKKADAAISPE